jgi:hypothetical protein
MPPMPPRARLVLLSQVSSSVKFSLGQVSSFVTPTAVLFSFCSFLYFLRSAQRWF